MEKTKKTKKKRGKTAMIMIGSIILVIGVLVGGYFYSNMHPAYEKQRSRIPQLGFPEKQATLDNGSIINYGEGPANGPALLLIHGQGGDWEDYAPVLPELSKKFHIFAVDCYGHGESSHDPALYTCETNGKALAWFIENVIGEKCFVSGHSSGGILTAWLAAYDQDGVKGIVLEDPPLFEVLPEEMTADNDCAAWVDSFLLIHNYLNQTEEPDYAVYYVEHSYFMAFFGKLQNTMLNSVKEYRAKHPDEPVKIFWLPRMITSGMYLKNYDLRFGDTFYTGSWFLNVDQAEMLSRIKCPAIYLKAATRYGKDGMVYAANTDEDAQKVVQLSGAEMLTIKSGHNIHCEKPKFFISAFDQILEKAK